jgi:hypothetical protein
MKSQEILHIIVLRVKQALKEMKREISFKYHLSSFKPIKKISISFIK